MIYLLQAIAGLVLLLVSAEYVVRGAVGLAQRFGLSTLIIGITVVAFGTSAPEFVTALAAARNGSPGMAVGNIIGSNVANLLLILGVAALACPLCCAPRAIKRDGVVMLLATVLFIAMGWVGGILPWHGVVLVVLLFAYIGATYYAEANYAEANLAKVAAAPAHEVGEIEAVPAALKPALVFVLGGLLGLVFGAELFVRGGAGIARLAGVSEEVIGLTLIALGTSLPELATVVVASLRGHGDVAVGNVVGSNIFNLLAIGGGVAIIAPLPVPTSMLHFELLLLLAVSVLSALLMLGGRRLSRLEGGGLVVLYAGYILIQFVPGWHPYRG